MSEIKVITGQDVLWNFPNVFEPKSFEGGAPKYSIVLIIKKTDQITINKINTGIKSAYEVGANKLKGGDKTIPPITAIRTPLRDGDLERPDDENYKNAYFLTASSTTAPGIVDKNREEITDRAEIYSGVYGRASISFYAYNTNGNKGIACRLNNLQKIRDGERINGRMSAQDDFADVDDDFLS